MSKSRWRAHADAVIASVVADNPGLPEPLLRKKISDAYPFGERRYHPYKIWLSAVQRHLAPMVRKAEIEKVRTVPPGVCGYCAGAGCMFCSMEETDASATCDRLSMD